MGLREYFQRAGRRAQHNAQVLAAQRGLQPWDRVQSMQEIEASRIPPLDLDPAAGGGASGADMDPVAQAPDVPHDYPRPWWRGATSDYRQSGPGTINEVTGNRLRSGDIELTDASPGLPAQPVPRPQEEPSIESLYGQIFVEEPEGVAPQTSYSPVFGQSATFVPGTRIYGKDDPAKVREFNAMQAGQDDYDRRRRALEQAVAIPEGWEREMRADNPAAMMEARVRAANALAQGEQALGPRPSRALPSDVIRTGEVAKAQGQAQAQPYINVRDLQAMLGQAAISGRPEYAQDIVRRGEIAAGSAMQPNQWSLAEVLHQRALEIAKARNAGMFGDYTPAQAEAVAGAQQVAPAAGEPSAGPPQQQGTGRMLTRQQLQTYSLQTGLPVEQLIEQAKAAGYTIR